MPHPFTSTVTLSAVTSILLAGAGDNLELRPEPLAAGAELELFSEVVYELDFELVAAGESLPGFEMSFERRSEKTVTVLEPGEGGPRGIRIVYHSVEEFGEGPGIDGGDEVREVSLLDGEVVTVQRDGRGWAVLDDDDNELDDDLTGLVLDAEVCADELLFDVRMFVDAVSMVTLEGGSTIDIDEDLVIELFDRALDEDSGVFEDAEMVLSFSAIREHRETEERCAVFDVVVDVSGEIQSDLEVALELEGELWLDLESACVTEFVLEGEMAVGGEAEGEYGVELAGEGSFRLVLRAL